jgi:hypothetical protein
MFVRRTSKCEAVRLDFGLERWEYDSMEETSDARDPVCWPGRMEIQPHVTGKGEGEIKSAHLAQKPAASRSDCGRESESD